MPKLEENQLLNRILDKYRQGKDIFKEPDILEDNKDSEKKLHRKLPSHKTVAKEHKRSLTPGGIAGGFFGSVLGSARGGGFGGAAVGALAGSLIGGGVAYAGSKMKYRKYEKLTDSQKKELVKRYLKKQKERDNTSGEKFNRNVNRTGKLYAAGALATLPLSIGMLPYAAGIGKMKELSSKHQKELLHHSGVEGRVMISKPYKKKLPFYEENAYFDHNTKNLTKKKQVGSVFATSKRMWKPGIVSHELGHANIQKSRDIAGLLQRHAYAPTSIANMLGGGILPVGATYAATKNDTNEWKGGLKGLGIGAAANAGVLVPEFEASRRGILNMMRSSMSTKHKITNSASMLTLHILGQYF